MRTRARPRPWRDLVKHISVVNEVEAVAEEAGACARNRNGWETN